MPHFTPTQTRILAILSDGTPHTKTELMTALDDELAAPDTLRVHIGQINVKLRTIGQEIICRRLGYTSRYQHVRHLNGDGDQPETYQHVRLSDDSE